MNYQEKAYALEKLAEISIRMRKPGDWYVKQSVEVKDGMLLRSRYGNGDSPITAIEDHWDALTSLPVDQYLVTNANSKNRAAVRWNGFMWEAVEEPKSVLPC